MTTKKEAAQEAAIPAEMPKVRNVLVLMAIFESTAFSKLRKSFGNLTTCRHKGQNVLKEKVTTIQDPDTLPQQMQRKRFPSLVELSALFSPAIKIGLKYAKETKHTEENYFVHVNKGNVTVDNGLVSSIDFENLVLSKGNRTMPSQVSAVPDGESNVLTLTFNEMKQGEYVAHAADDDVFYCCAVEKKRYILKMEKLGTRSELSETPGKLVLPDTWEVSAENIAVYLFCTDKSGRKASRTLYLPIA